MAADPLAAALVRAKLATKKQVAEATAKAGEAEPVRHFAWALVAARRLTKIAEGYLSPIDRELVERIEDDPDAWLRRGHDEAAA